MMAVRLPHHTEVPVCHLSNGERSALHCHTIVVHKENAQGAKALIYKSWTRANRFPLGATNSR
jgi:hypothetical protein